MIRLEKRDTNKKAEVYRKEGYIPGILYGPGIENQLVCISKKDFLKYFTQLHMRFNFEFEGKQYSGILQEVQKHPVTLEPIHFDIYIPSLAKEVSTTIPIIIEGEDEILRKGYILNKLLNELEVEGLMEKLPQNIKIDVSNLELGQTIYVKDLKITGDFKILTHPETPIVSVIEITTSEESGEL